MNVKSYRKEISLFLILLFISIISIIYLLLIPTSTSLLKQMFAFDTNIWRIIGWAWYDGRLVYEDIFDHKGPYQFLIFAIANTPVKLFCLETLNLTLVLYTLFKTGQLIIESNWQIFFGILIFLWMFIRTIQEGGQCEEWCLLPTVVSLYLFIRYLINKKKSSDSTFFEHPKTSTLVYGISFGFIAFVRINNGYIIAMIILYLVVFYLLKGQWKATLPHIGAFLLGVATPIVPMVVYFALKGTLSAMIFGSFEYNILYKGALNPHQISYGSLLNVFYPLSFLFLTNIVTSIFFDVKHKIGISYFSLILIFVFVMFPNWGVFPHYFTVYLPLAFLSVIYIYGFGVNKIITTCAVFLWFIVPHWEENIYTVRCIAHQRVYPLFGMEKYENLEEEEIHNIIELIPENERDSVASCSNFGGLQLWVEMRKVPEDKYFFNSPTAREISTVARDEIECYYQTTRPLWIFTAPNEKDSLLTTILQDYHLRYKSPETSETNYYLWHRK